MEFVESGLAEAVFRISEEFEYLGDDLQGKSSSEGSIPLQISRLAKLTLLNADSAERVQAPRVRLGGAAREGFLNRKKLLSWKRNYCTLLRGRATLLLKDDDGEFELQLCDEAKAVVRVVDGAKHRFQALGRPAGAARDSGWGERVSFEAGSKSEMMEWTLAIRREVRCLV